MFYARINQIKVFNNREGFLGLFNRAEMQIYSYVRPFTLSMEAAPENSLNRDLRDERIDRISQ
jgi:hypothetical protein